MVERDIDSRVKPKSDTQLSWNGERRTLVDLMFPWVKLRPPWEWMWAIPLAVPSAIFNREVQSSRVLPMPLLPVICMERYCEI